MLNELQMRNYFSPSEASFWRWQDNGQVVCWADGRTIAFREELLTVLERMAADGLPPLGAVLLVLSACRENWPESPSRRGILLGLLAPPEGIVSSDDLNLLTEVCRGLDNVHELAAEQRGTPAAKAELCDLVFHGKDEQYLDPSSMQLIVGFQIGLTPEQLEPIASEGIESLRGDLKALRAGLSRVESNRLTLRTQTGLEQTVLPADIDVPPAEAARRLITQLQSHPELSGVARLARRLLSVVQWPRPLTELSEMPAGGFSDIANRGTLDRLLLSELAADDTTLAVRVANGEAMYLRREVPPSIPPRDRVVLIDVGIRMWGVPRVFATAVGMALVAASQSNFPVAAYRADGPDLVEADLASEAGLVAQLAALDYRAHPGESLPQWEALLSNSAASDTVLITGEDVLDDAEFRQALDRLSLDGCYLAIVNRDGKFRLLRHSRAGNKLIREAQFTLDEVLAPDPVAKPLVNTNDGGQLPAFLHQYPLPLLLSRSFDLDTAWLVRGDGLLALTKDNRLVLWTEPDRGSQELAAGMPPGKIHWCSTVANETAWAIIGRLSPKGLYTIAVDLTAKRLTSEAQLQIDMNDSNPPRGAFYHQGYVYVVFPDRVNLLDPHSGELISSINTLAGSKWWERDRYFRVNNLDAKEVWLAAAYRQHMGHGEMLFQAVPTSHLRGQRVAAMFDAATIEGPVIVTISGQIHFADGSMKPIVRQSRGPISVIAVSRDGHRFVIEGDRPAGSNPSAGRLMVYTLTGQTRAIQQDPRMAVDWIFNDIARPRQVRYRFQGVGVDAQGRLTLVSRHGTQWPLELADNGQRYLFPKNGWRGKAIDNTLRWKRFESVESWNGTEHQGLSVAKFDSGDRAILDSRGLLHLQAGDGRVPEFTVLLCEGESAGWCADGRWWGPKYFRGDRMASPVGEIVREVIAPFIKGLE